MSHPLDARATEELPQVAAKPASWKLVEDAPAAETPAPRDRAGAARGMMLLLVGGGLFWGVIATAIWFASR